MAAKKIDKVPEGAIDDRDPESLLTTDQAAKFLAVKPSRLERLRSEGGGPEITRIGERTIRYRRQDLIDWAARGRAASTASYETST